MEPNIQRKTSIFNRSAFYTLLFLSLFIIFPLLFRIGRYFFHDIGMDFRSLFVAIIGTPLFFIISTIIFETIRSTKIKQHIDIRKELN